MNLRLVGAGAALVLISALPGCGKSTPSSSGSVPKAWAKNVCTSLKNWNDGVQRKSKDLQSSLTASDVNPTKVKQQFQKFFDGSVSLTDTLLADLDKAGAPDVDKGDQLAKDLQSSVRAARKFLADAGKQTQQLPTANVADFGKAVGALGADVTKGSTTVGEAFNKLDKETSPSLQRALDAEPACKNLR